ncbi:MAG: hypothetical protein HQL08_09535 [Nitrospirae bacterium]|nr:hypothetical protein [Nitrospirota bacterium]
MNINNIIGFMKELISFGKKKEAREVIYSAEVSVLSSGLSIIDVLKNVRQELNSNLYLDNAISLLSKGKPRSMAYKNILDVDIINMLKSAEAKQITAGDIFKDYINMKYIIEKAESRMRGALMEPTIMYLMVSFISYFAINTFYNNFRGITNMDMSNIGFIRNYYFLIVAAPMFAVHFVIMKFPDKVPLWSRVYRYVKSAGYLLVIKTLVDLGMSSVDAISFFKKLNDKQLHKRINVLKTHEKNIEGLTRALSYYLSSVEIALMKTSVKFAEEKRTLSGIVEKRMMDVEKTVSGITATFNKLLTALTILPIVMVVYVLLSILGALTQRV